MYKCHGGDHTKWSNFHILQKSWLKSCLSLSKQRLKKVDGILDFFSNCVTSHPNHQIISASAATHPLHDILFASLSRGIHPWPPHTCSESPTAQEFTLGFFCYLRCLGSFIAQRVPFIWWSDHVTINKAMRWDIFKAAGSCDGPMDSNVTLQ